jgi:hypothetical protein
MKGGQGQVKSMDMDRGLWEGRGGEDVDVDQEWHGTARDGKSAHRPRYQTQKRKACLLGRKWARSAGLVNRSLSQIALPFLCFEGPRRRRAGRPQVAGAACASRESQFENARVM